MQLSPFYPPPGWEESPIRFSSVINFMDIIVAE